MMTPTETDPHDTPAADPAPFCDAHALTPGYVSWCVNCARQREADMADLAAQVYAGIADEVSALADHSTGAYTHVCQMIGGAKRLTGSELYDIELAEGADGEDLIRELEAAAAHLRNAARIIADRQRLLDETGS
jgi:hypothetical protein